MTQRRTDLDPEVAQLLEVLDAGFPDVTAFPPAEVRAKILARRAPLTREPDLAIARDLTIDGPGGDLPVRVYVPHGEESSRPVLLFGHGGGFVFCDLDSHDGFCRAMAEGVDAVVVAVDYRLAPEHRAPAAVEDMFAALQWVHSSIGEFGGDPQRIVVVGDSAGGNLAATLSLYARDHNGPTLAGQVMLYPMIDDDTDTESYRRYGKGYYNDESAMNWYWDQYAPEPQQRTSPYVMPILAEDLSGLPPAVIMTAELDPPSDSGRSYAEKLAAQGVSVDFHCFDGLFHGFLTMPTLSHCESGRELVWQKIRGLLGE